MGDITKPIVLMLILFGTVFYFMAGYMDAFALTSRRGSEAAPSSNPDRVWELLGVLIVGIGVSIWFIRQWV